MTVIKRRELIFVLDSASATINLHPLHKRIVNSDNLSNDIAGVGVHTANFQPLVT
jgi:hypothetical protein